ncbi:DUF3422 family protein [Alkalilimnicola ehrlichii MLHE-1]|uniref:Uncharacterized membrane-anchored protein n=1 Tax=Alkalilimnicola ehrlichii (strain ATCC BAA-1101 / DSM 17681 / MLHE-1) TaxID=187272 RepID=Q0AB14_ALKEH|nr:DUF3422 domain-containing protein [Alkalilimnicola ehrlichii]ABI55973.1 uncharacterized membrane-anchored protein [Alkalilimnicola ehrlichii MLHE-1]
MNDDANAYHLTDHPLRRQIHDEVHARPFEILRAPMRVSHLAMLSGRHGADADRQHVAALCERFGVAPPASGANHLSEDFGPFRLKWERRTEFSTYTFFVHGAFDHPFENPAIDQVPLDWLERLPGKRLVAIHLGLESADMPARSVADTVALFNRNTVVGSVVSDGAARAWTDFRIHDDGYSRMLVRDIRLRERQAGRVVQRLLDIETYRMMALLAFPVAGQVSPELTALEERLASMTQRLTDIRALEDEQGLLADLSSLAAKVERIGNATHYRFNAARAYYALVERRMAELREQRIPGMQTIKGFLERRLEPAMRTCESVARRQESLARRVARTGDLLRTRVDVALEAQNRDLLDSMNRRARLQMRLQETVEGLSVVAISYYGVSLVGYLLGAGRAAGLDVSVDLLRGAAVPLVVAMVWLGVRWVKRRVVRRSEA